MRTKALGPTLEIPKPAARREAPAWRIESRRRRRRIEARRRLAERSLRQGRPRAALATYLRISEEGLEALGLLNRASEALLATRHEEGMALLLHVADLYRREGFGIKATALYRKALRLDPSRRDLHAPLAALYRQRGLEAEARALERERS